MNAPTKHQGRRCVPKVVEPDLRQPPSLKQPVEGLVHLDDVQEVTAAPAEDEVAIEPKRTCGEALLQLPGTMPP